MSVSAVKKEWWLTCFAEQQQKPDWLQQLQQEENQLFVSRGLPTRADERWKYSDVGFLARENYNPGILTNEDRCQALVAAKRHRLTAHMGECISVVFINGHFSAALSDVSSLPDGVVFSNMQAALTSHADVMKQYLQARSHSAFANLNTALLTDGVYLHVPANIEMKTPLHLLYINAEQNNIVNCPRHMFVLDTFSQAIILEEHMALGNDNYFSNIVTDIHLDTNASLKLFKIQNESQNAIHNSQTITQQKQDSALEIFHLAVGAKFAREEVAVHLNETAASARVNGFYCLNNDGQHIDHHIQIDHKATHGTSEMFYKGILDQQSHGVFNGKIYAHKGATKTHSQQANHNLLLSKAAAIDTKPEFEIYADDVKCAHGATIGQVDNEALFYLRSRGIDMQTAMKLLTAAFADNVMARISEPGILQYMNRLLIEKLANDN